MKKTGRAVFFLVLFLVLGAFFLSRPEHSSSAAPDPRWKPFGDKSDGNEYFYDSKTVDRVQENTVRVWHKTVFGKADAGYRETVHFIEMDCKAKMFRVLDGYGKNAGGALQPGNFIAGWSRFTPESPMEKLSNEVCKKPQQPKKK